MGNANGPVILAGGSGFLGLSMARHHAAAGMPVVILSRSAPKPTGPWRHVGWDARHLGDWKRELDGARAIVNLVGRSVDCVKTPDHQDEILRSRVEATRVLGDAVRAVASPPPVWVQMSTAHIYGDPPNVVCDETSAFGYGLAPFVATSWEDACAASVLPTQRLVVIRASFVVGRNAGAGNGALGKLAIVARMGLGGRIGTGRQGMSWIHEADLDRVFERAIVDPSMQGAYIASSPQPLPQVDFMRTLRRAVGMPIGLPAPDWLIRFGAKFVMKTDPELAIYGRYVMPARLLAEGFAFRFPTLDAALADLFPRRA